MPNIVSTQGLTIYNITEVGSADTTGAASTFIINPLEGYYIAASQFSLAILLDEYPEVSSVTFSDTTSPYTIDNTVLVTVTWNGVTSLTSDFNLPINISFDDVENVYDSNTTSLTFNIAKNDIEGLYDNQKVTFTPILDQVSNFNVQSIETGGYGPNFLINPNHIQISCFVTQSGQTPILDITIEANSEGLHFLGSVEGEDTEPFVLNQTVFPDTSTGIFELILINTQLDLFNNVYLKTYRLYYTRDDNNVDTGAEFNYTSLFPQEYKVTNYITDTLHVSGLGHGDALDGAGTSTSEIGKAFKIKNIPYDNIIFEYADTWANDGEEITFYTGTDENGASGYEYHFDIEGNVGSSRQMQVTVKDDLYNIERTSFIIQQDETPFIELKLIGSDDQEFNIYGNILQDPVLLDSGKVISNPSLDENVFGQIPGGGGNTPSYFGADTGIPFITQPLYALVVLTDSSVSAIDLQDALIVEQDGYPLDAFPQADWVSFPQINNLSSLGTGIYIAYFSIRNQDKFNYLGVPVVTQDRTATISVAHPSDPTQTDTLTITQDARYNSSVDTATIKVDKYITLDGLFGIGEPSYSQASSDNITDDEPVTLFDVQNVDVENYRLYIKMDDWENDFNLPNIITTNPNQTDTYKQYPRPKLVVNYPNSSFSVVNGDVVSASGSSTGLVIDVDDLVFNENYDPSDSNNDYQYYVDYTLAQNTTYDTRQYVFYVFHSQYEGAYDLNNADDTFIHTQPSLKIVSIQQSTSGEEFIPFYEAATPHVLKYNGLTPTIGFWTPALGPSSFEEIVFGQQYDDWFTINTLLSANTISGQTSQSFLVNHAANTPVGDRSITVALYHSDSTPGVDYPDNQYTFTQLAEPIDPNVHYVQVFSLPGAILEYSGSSQELVTYIRVGDYTADDFSSNTNAPEVEIIRWNGPGVEDGAFVNEDGLYDTDGIIENSYDMTQVVQPSPTYAIVDPVVGVQHTHSVTFTTQANTLGIPYFIAVRAKHQYATSYSSDNYRIYTINTEEVLTFKQAFYDDTEYSMATVGDTKQISLPNSAQQLTFELMYNVSNIEPNDPLWPSGPNEDSKLTYTTARFLTFSNLDVFDEYGTSAYDSVDQNGIPLTFADVGNSPYIFHDGVSETTSSVEENISPVALAFPNTGFGITLNLAENNTGGDLISYIGVWKGSTSPKTNLIDLSQFEFTNTFPEVLNTIDPTPFGEETHMSNLTGDGNQSGFLLDWYVNNILISNNVIEPIESSANSGVFDGFKWNQSDSYTDTFVDSGEYAHLQFRIFKPQISGGQVSLVNESNFGNNKVLGVSFEVEDFEALGEGNSTCGIIGSLGTYWNPFPLDLSLYDSLMFNSNGKYEARIKMSNPSNGSANHLRFLARARTKFTVKNLKVWEIEDDIIIRPPSTDDGYQTSIPFNTPPDDILKIIQAPMPAGLAFDYSAGTGTLTNTPVSAAINIVSVDSGVLTINGSETTFNLSVIPVSYVPVLGVQVTRVTTSGAQWNDVVFYIDFIDGSGVIHSSLSPHIAGINQVFINSAVNEYEVSTTTHWPNEIGGEEVVRREFEFRLYSGYNPLEMDVFSGSFAPDSNDQYIVKQNITYFG